MKPKPLFENRETILAKVQAAPHLLLALDYDGTLSTLARAPEQAEMSPEAVATLSAMSAVDRVSIAVLSGRSLSDLRRRIPFPAALIANHGLEMETREFSFVHPAAVTVRPYVERACWDLRQAFEAVAAVRVENKELSATVHYEAVPQEIRNWVRDTTTLVLRPYGKALCSKRAPAAVEIRPRIGWNTCGAVRHLLRRAGDTGVLLFCAGEDRADADLFGAVPFACSLNYRVHSQAALLNLLGAIDDRLKNQDPRPSRIEPALADSSGPVPEVPRTLRSSGA